MIIDATNLIIGRMGTKVAKQALLGETIEIVNCENAVITGNRRQIIGRYNQRRNRGEPFHGPFFPRTPDRLVKRMIRGMLPYKKERGEKALKKIKCYIGVPVKLEKEKTETIAQANISKVPNVKHMTVGELCHELGGFK